MNYFIVSTRSLDVTVDALKFLDRIEIERNSNEVPTEVKFGMVNGYSYILVSYPWHL